MLQHEYSPVSPLSSWSVPTTTAGSPPELRLASLDGALGVLDDRTYVYRITHEGRVQHCLLTLLAVDHLRDGRVLPHEKILAAKAAAVELAVERDPFSLPPLYLAYQGAVGLREYLGVLLAGKTPLIDAQTKGTRHQVFRLPSIYGSVIARMLASAGQVVIADGHHRAAAWASCHRRLGGNYAYLPAVLAPARDCSVRGFHRLVSGLNGHTPATLIEALADDFFISTESGDLEPGSFALFAGNRWWRLRRTDWDIASPDAVHLQERVLARHLGVGDPRTDARIEYLPGEIPAHELEARVRSSPNTVALRLAPPPIGDIFDTVAAGNLLPPHSTCFQGKPLERILTLLKDSSCVT